MFLDMPSCQGWAPEFEKRVGAPSGPAHVVDGVMRRSFKSGTNVSWVVGSKSVQILWGG